MLKTRFISGVFLLLKLHGVLLAAPPVLAQVNVTPPKVFGERVEAETGIFVEEILAIREGENAFDVKGYLELVWYDERLKFDAADLGIGKKIYLEHDADLMLQKIWWPDLEFVNQVRGRERLNEELIISADGKVEYRERFIVTLATNFEMRQFPFDRQRLLIEVESFAWSSDDLALKKRGNLVGFSREFRLPGWTIERIDEAVREHMEPRDRAPFSELQAVITVKRNPGFFLWKFLIPLTIVMLLISAVLWIPPDQIKDRVSATLTGILTSAAYGFTIARYLPEHVYDTYLDAVVMLSVLYSAAMMVLNIVSYRLNFASRSALALKCDRVGRIAFPAGFLSALVILYAVYVRA